MTGCFAGILLSTISTQSHVNGRDDDGERDADKETEEDDKAVTIACGPRTLTVVFCSDTSEGSRWEQRGLREAMACFGSPMSFLSGEKARQAHSNGPDISYTNNNSELEGLCTGGATRSWAKHPVALIIPLLLAVVVVVLLLACRDRIR